MADAAAERAEELADGEISAACQVDGALEHGVIGVGRQRQRIGQRLVGRSRRAFAADLGVGAAVNGQACAGDIRRLRTGDERDHRRNIVDAAVMLFIGLLAADWTD